MTALKLLASLLRHPQATLSSLLHGEGALAALVTSWGLYLVSLAASHAETLGQNMYLLSSHPARAVGYVWRQVGRGPAHADLGIWLGATVILVVVLRLRRPNVRWLGAFAAASVVLLPLALLHLVSSSLALLGWDGWWLTHHSVDSQWVVVFSKAAGRQVSWLRFTAKLGITYGLPTVLWALAVKTAWANTASTAMPPSVARWMPPAIGGAVVAVVVVVAGATFAKRDQLKPVLQGDRVPDVELRYISHLAPKKMFSLADVDGKVLVLDFWASWCRPCRKAVPHLNALVEAFPDDVVVVGVNREPGQRASSTAKVMQEWGFRFPSVRDHRAGRPTGFGEQVGLQSLPTTLVVGRDGQVRKVHLGISAFDQLHADVEQAVHSP